MASPEKKAYAKELARLQVELVRLHEWIKSEGHRVLVLFEGRDAAGKGGTIKRISQRLSARVCRVVALPKPTHREHNAFKLSRKRKRKRSQDCTPVSSGHR